MDCTSNRFAWSGSSRFDPALERIRDGCASGNRCVSDVGNTSRHRVGGQYRTHVLRARRSSYELSQTEIIDPQHGDLCTVARFGHGLRRRRRACKRISQRPCFDANHDIGPSEHDALDADQVGRGFREDEDDGSLHRAAECQLRRYAKSARQLDLGAGFGVQSRRKVGNGVRRRTAAKLQESKECVPIRRGLHASGPLTSGK